MTHSLKSLLTRNQGSWERRIRPRCIQALITRTESGPLLFLLCAGLQAASGKPSGFHPGEVDSPFTTVNLKPSALHTLGLCLFLSVSREQWQLHRRQWHWGLGLSPRADKEASPLLLEQRGWPGEMEGSKGFCQRCPAIQGLENMGTWAPATSIPGNPGLLGTNNPVCLSAWEVATLHGLWTWKEKSWLHVNLPR